MLSENHQKELETLTVRELKAVVNIMRYQICAPLFVGSKQHSIAVLGAATRLMDEKTKLGCN